ncbi:MAG: hypothetical protein ABFD66_03665 [Smithella sp.]
MIREEIEDALAPLGVTGNSIRPRIKELLSEAKGYEARYTWIKRSGQTRKTKSGLNAEVLVAI